MNRILILLLLLSSGCVIAQTPNPTNTSFTNGLGSTSFLNIPNLDVPPAGALAGRGWNHFPSTDKVGYKNNAGVWKTLLNESRILTINGVSYDLTQDRSWTVSASTVPSLQAVTTVGNVSSNAIGVTGLSGFNGTTNGIYTLYLGEGSGNAGYFYNNYNGAQRGGLQLGKDFVSLQFDNGVTSNAFSMAEELSNQAGATISSRLSLQPALNLNEVPILSQVPHLVAGTGISIDSTGRNYTISFTGGGGANSLQATTEIGNSTDRGILVNGNNGISQAVGLNIGSYAGDGTQTSNLFTQQGSYSTGIIQTAAAGSSAAIDFELNGSAALSLQNNSGLSGIFSGRVQALSAINAKELPTFDQLPMVIAGSNVTVTPTTVGNHTQYSIASTASGGGGGTVTNVSAIGTNGIFASVTNPTTTPAITISGASLAPATGSANYINNQTGTAQTADYNISGNGALKNLIVKSDNTSTGSQEDYIFKAAADQLNTTATALYIYPKSTAVSRFFFGTSTNNINLDMTNVSSVNAMPGFLTKDAMGFGLNVASHSVFRAGVSVIYAASGGANADHVFYTDPTGFNQAGGGTSVETFRIKATDKQLIVPGQIQIATAPTLASHAVRKTELDLKQNQVSLTTTGSGAATFNQSTGALNIPTPSAGGSGTVTSFSKTDGYGITSSVTNPTTTPNYTAAVDTTSTGGVVSKARLTAGLALKGNLAGGNTWSNIQNYVNSGLRFDGGVDIRGGSAAQGVFLSPTADGTNAWSIGSSGNWSGAISPKFSIPQNGNMFWYSPTNSASKAINKGTWSANNYTYTLPNATGNIAVTADYVFTLDFPSIAANSGQSIINQATNSSEDKVNYPIIIGLPINTPDDVIYKAWIPANGFISIRAFNLTGAAIDPPSGTFTLTVVRPSIGN